MANADDRMGPRRQGRDALERLYALWLFSTLLILLVLAVLVFIMNAQIGAQADRISEQNQRLARLERGLALNEEVDRAAHGRLTETRDEPPHTQPAVFPPPATQPRPTASRPSETTTRPAAEPPPAAMDDSTLTTRIDMLLRDTPPSRSNFTTRAPLTP